jgi:hypothetical protein
VRINDLYKLGNSSKQALFAASVVIVGVALYNWIVAPHVTYLRAVNRYEPVVERIAQEKASLKDLLISRQKRLADLEAQFSLIRPLLFTVEQARQLLSDLEVMAAEEKCSMMTVDLGSNRPTRIVGDEQETLLVEGVDTSVTLTGSYDGIMALIGRLQAQQRKIWIRTLTLELAGPETQKLRCRMDIGIYVIKEKEAVSHD